MTHPLVTTNILQACNSSNPIGNIRRTPHEPSTLKGGHANLHSHNMELTVLFTLVLNIYMCVCVC